VGADGGRRDVAGLCEPGASDLDQILRTRLGVKRLMSKTALSQAEWLPATTAPFDCELELAVIGPDVHTLVFPCRRVLGGWIKAETKERIAAHPTHWRRWTRQALGSDVLGAEV
jgi:hypothetical protein